jgi:spermidine/putrescine transport system permease protein
VRSPLDRLRDGLLGVWSLGAVIFLFVPIFVIVLFSFNDNQGRFDYNLK